MIIKADFLIEGYLRNSLFSNTTSELYFDTDKRNFYLEVKNNKTDELITRIYLDDILNAMCDIIR